MKRVTFAAAALVTLATSACLQKEAFSTLYLRDDGSVEWVLVERDVRSDEGDLAKRAAEESQYVDAVTRDQHEAAQSFRLLGGHGVEARLVRDRRPYVAVIGGRFDSLDALVARPLTACGIEHSISKTGDGTSTTWTLKALVGPALGEDGPWATDQAACDAIGGLLDTLPLRLVLENGRFAAAAGFTQVADDTVEFGGEADQKALEAAVEANGGWLVMTLTWTRQSK